MNSLGLQDLLQHCKPGKMFERDGTLCRTEGVCKDGNCSKNSVWLMNMSSGITLLCNSDKNTKNIRRWVVKDVTKLFLMKTFCFRRQFYYLHGAFLFFGSLTVVLLLYCFSGICEELVSTWQDTRKKSSPVFRRWESIWTAPPQL